MPSDCLVSIMWGMERDKTITRPLLVPTHRVGQVDTVFSMKVHEKWRLRTRLPSSAITLRSGRQESGTSFSGINGVVSDENCNLFFSCTLAVWLLLKMYKHQTFDFTDQSLHIWSDLILLNDSLREFLIELLVPVNGLSSELSMTAFTVALQHKGVKQLRFKFSVAIALSIR